MADQTTRPGRLIAVDASRGKDLMAEAETLALRLRAKNTPCGVSRWDASGMFADLLLDDREQMVVSPRMLALLYAADLMFRLRWEIRPALAGGHIVIAAPYVDTAVAVGVGLGLPEPWLRDLLRFADRPDDHAFASERKRTRGWKASTSRGYGEYCAALLEASPAGLATRKARRRSVAWLESAAKEAGGGRLTRKALAALVKRYRQPSGTA